MKKHLDFCLLYSDTNSFVNEIRSDNLYEEIARNGKLRKEFDFSNLTKNHHLYNTDQMKVTLLFKRIRR